MRELAYLGVVMLVLFIAFVIYWNRKWKNHVLDEREIFLRLKVRELIARAIEIALVVGVAFHFFVQPLTGLQVFVLIGASGVLVEAFGNWWLRRDVSGQR